MINKLLLILITIVWLIPLAIQRDVAAYQPEWKEVHYNPNPNPDGKDFILPLPAGGAITFRPVLILQSKLTDTKRFKLGNSNDKYAPMEYPRHGSISGVFEDKEDKRVFYIGKYEITESQYDVVMDDIKPAVISNLPKVNLSWFNAIRFSHQLTLWLMKYHKALLPKDGQTSGYIRLPTEEEWEFACRGGELVERNFFYRDHFIPDNEDYTDYVQFYRTGDIEEIQPIGYTKKPNPLGIFDMLGNAGEICFNVFRLNYHYGRSGGYVVKGGDIDTPGPEDIRSSYRIEVPFYDKLKADAFRSLTDGFRVVITAPLLTSLQRNEKIVAEWKEDKLPQKGELRLSFEEALEKIDAISRQVSDPKIQREINAIKNSQDNIARQLNEIELNDAVVFVRIGAYAANTIATQAQRVQQVEHLLNNIRQDKARDPAFFEQLQENHRKFNIAIAQDLETYGDAVESLSGKYENGPDIVNSAIKTVIEQKKLHNQEHAIPAVELLYAHVKGFKQRNAAGWRKDIERLKRPQ